MDKLMRENNELNKEDTHDGFDICRTSQDYLKQKRDDN